MIIVIAVGFLLAAEPARASSAKAYPSPNAAKPMALMLPQTPIVVRLAPEKNVLDLEARRESEENAHAWREIWLVWLTGALAAATLALGWFTYLLWKATTAALREAAANQEISRESLQLARNTSAWELRSYVYPELTRFDLQASVERDGLHYIDVELGAMVRNSGETPALKLRAQAFIKALPWPETGEIAGPSALDDFTMVARNSSLPLNFRAVTSFKRSDVAGGSVRVYVRVVTEYDDVFGKGHRSEYHGTVTNLEQLLTATSTGIKGNMQINVVALNERCLFT